MTSTSVIPMHRRLNLYVEPERRDGLTRQSQELLGFMPMRVRIPPPAPSQRLSSFHASAASLAFAITTCCSSHAASRPVFSDSTLAPDSRALNADAAMSHGERDSCTKRSNVPIAT